MKRRTSIGLTARALLFSGAVLFAGAGRSYGQQSDIDAVKAAVDAYHSALGPLAGEKMKPLWAHDAKVMLINPRDKTVTPGWEAVNKAWEASDSIWSELKVTTLEGPHVVVKGDVAWSSTMALAVGKSKTGAAINSPTLEADVFEKTGGKWLLVSHSASSRSQ